MVVVLIVMGTFMVLCLLMLVQTLMPALGDDSRLKTKNLQLEAKYTQLEQENAILRKQNETLMTEVIAHRNQLPWVNVEEIDGTQE